MAPTTQQPATPVTQKPSTCACKDDEIYKGSCYVIRSEFRNFENSEKGCQEIGGHLVAIEDKDEMDHVKSMYTGYVLANSVCIAIRLGGYQGCRRCNL